MNKFLLPPSDIRRWRAGSEPHRQVALPHARVRTPCPRRAVSEAPLSEAQRAALEASQARALAKTQARAERALASHAAGRQGWVCP